MGLNPVVWYSFHEGNLDICSFVPLRIATVLRIQHGVLALYVLPAVGFSSFSSSQLLWTSMPLAEFVACHGQARVRVTLPPSPLHPGHDPAVGWAIFFRNDIFASLYSLGWTLPRGFSAVGGFADPSAHFRGSSIPPVAGDAIGLRSRGCYFGMCSFRFSVDAWLLISWFGRRCCCASCALFYWYQTGHSAVAKIFGFVAFMRHGILFLHFICWYSCDSICNAGHPCTRRISV